jgi:hypothetical protein
MTGIAGTLAIWHDFFVVAAGATAVLLGLTFVGLTLHVERASLDSTRRGLALAWGTSLVYALLASFALLIPEGVPYAQGSILVVIGLLGLVSSSYALRQVWHDPERHVGRYGLVFQFGVPVMATAGLFLSGFGLGIGWPPAVWAVGAVVFILLVDGIQSAWDLLRIGFV